MEVLVRDIVVDVSQIIKRKNRKIYLHFHKPNSIVITTPYKLSNEKINEYLDSAYRYIKKKINYVSEPKQNVLHLFGYDHIESADEVKMLGLQREIMALLS